MAASDNPRDTLDSAIALLTFLQWHPMEMGTHLEGDTAKRIEFARHELYRALEDAEEQLEKVEQA